MKIAFKWERNMERRIYSICTRAMDMTDTRPNEWSRSYDRRENVEGNSEY
jgi:hypothetical protein